MLAVSVFAEEKCNALGDQLEEYAQKEAPEGQLKVKVGQVCLAHFDTDNAWYRARVLETSQSNVKVSLARRISSEI